MPRNDALDSYLDSLGGSSNSSPKRDSSPRKPEPQRKRANTAPQEARPQTERPAPRVQPARPKVYPSQRYRNSQPVQEPKRVQRQYSAPSEDETAIQSMLDDISSSTVEINKPAERKSPHHTNRQLSNDLDEFLARAEREDAEKRKRQAEIDAASRKASRPQKTEREMIQESLYEEEDKAPSESLQELFAQSESFFKDDWIEMYEKAQRSRKNNEIADKIRRGRFRINREHQVEILPDMRTDDKSADDMLGSQWL